ncbi:MAG: glycosyltransferase family 4 protein, partial [Acutalibacteraceae bacterium]|nr:glycosyltransferase family 4 protein [Acutalibacteraceae bacterium]
IPNNIFIDGVKECTLLMISNYLRKKVINLCGQEIDKNVKILHNGFDYKTFSQGLDLEEKRSLKQSLGIPETKKIVVFAGRINRDKGIEELTAAFNNLERDDVVLLVIGSRYFADKRISAFENKMKQIFENMEEKVRFTGYIPYENMWKYYSIADLAVLPSIWEEPAGLTIVESMSAGLPVITTNSGGIPEFIDDRFGIILERDDKLVENIKLSINNILDNLPEWKLKGEESSKYIAKIVDEEKYYNTFCEYIS